MILVDPDMVRRHSASGVWGKATLDSLLARAAATRPDAVALLAPAAHELPGPAEPLSWSEIDRRVSTLSATFLEAGLRQDEILAIQLANTAEHVIACLAAMRAGLIPAVFPVLWRRREMIAACRRISPAALLTASRIGPVPHGEMMCHVAAETPSARRVLAFGNPVPDGVQPLDEALSGTAPAQGAAGVPRPGNPADHVAMITFTDGPGGPRPLARSHNQWLSAAMMVVLAARIGPGASLLTPIQPAGLGGLAAGFLAWLLTGCRLHLRAPDADLPGAVADCGATHCVLPGPIALELLPAGKSPEAKLIRLWADPLSLFSAGRRSTTDIVSLGEMALWAGEDLDGPTISLSHAPETSTANPQSKLLSVRMQGAMHKAGGADTPGALLRGALIVGGPQLPDIFPGGGAPEEELAEIETHRRTGLECRLVEARPPRVRVLAHASETFRHGGMLVRADTLDQLYGGAPGVRDAAVLGLPHPVFGHVFHAALVPEGGEACSLAEFREYLSAVGAAPYMWPERIVAVTAIPRGADGAVLRHLIEPRTAAA